MTDDYRISTWKLSSCPTDNTGMLTQLLILALWSCLLFANQGYTEPDKPCPDEPRCKCQEATYITKKKTAVTCRNRSLTEVPTNLPNNTVYLDLSQNQIKSIGVKQFINYTGLNLLNISLNNLTEVKPGAFDGLQNLRSLSLRNNSIRYNSSNFQPGIFKPLVNLERLNIQQNFSRNDYTGEDYSLEALYDLPALQSLSLDGIPTKNLGPVFQNLTSLIALNFTTRWGPSRCLLRKLTPNFFRPNTNISNITLSNCDIKMIEAKSFEQLTKLLYLDLSHNEELTFNSMLNISAGLNSTQISTLKLNKVYRTLGSCVTITPENLKGFTKLSLKVIYLESNRIATLDRKAVKHIPTSLETISLRDNIIMLDNYIAEFFQHNFTNLQKFIMSDQNRNHYILDFKEEPVSRSKRNAVLQLNGILPSAADKQTEKNRVRKLQWNKNDRVGKNDNQNINPHTKIQENQDVYAKIANVVKRHSGVNEDIKSAKEKGSTADNQKVDENALDAMLKRKIAKWMAGIPIPLPENLRSLDASNMKIRLVLYTKTLVTPNNLRELSLNRNIFWAWYGPFRGFENLTRLDLSWNSCNTINLTIFKDMPNLLALNLTRNYLDTSLNRDSKGILFRSQGKLEVLSISENKIRTLPKNIFVGLKNLITLHLARNLLQTFEVDLSHMVHLKKLNLYDNQLETISKSVRDTVDHLARNFTINLVGNNFKCDCANLDFVKWMSESPVKFENKQKYVCHLKDRTKVNLTHARRIYEALEKECYNYTPIIVSSTAALVLVFSLSAAAVVYRYRWNLRYMYYMAKYKAKVPKARAGGYQAIETTEEQVKDVNVSYADEDSGFIRQKIYTELEVNRGLKLHIRDRDSPIAAVSENIVDAIERTKKTLIIMSKSYLKHKWCIFEMHMAGIKALKTDTNLLCVLLLEEVPHRDLPLKIMKIIKDQEHLEYPGEDNLQECFWDRMKAALSD